jgi:hypothetical protein
MRELGKYFRIYCTETHKKWPELVPHIQEWMNSSVVETIGYAPVELLDGKPRPNILQKLLKKRSDQLPTDETVAEKVLKAYARTKVKANGIMN